MTFESDPETRLDKDWPTNWTTLPVQSSAVRTAQDCTLVRANNLRIGISWTSAVTGGKPLFQRSYAQISDGENRWLERGQRRFYSFEEALPGQRGRPSAPSLSHKQRRGGLSPEESSTLTARLKGASRLRWGHSRRGRLHNHRTIFIHLWNLKTHLQHLERS